MAITNFDGEAKRDSGLGGEGGAERKINKREALIQSFCENRAKLGLFGKKGEVIKGSGCTSPQDPQN